MKTIANTVNKENVKKTIVFAFGKLQDYFFERINSNDQIGLVIKLT
ncbi:hypothetical protein RB619_04145 [Flavobacterium sp. LHD-80]|nr:hypothetical protein [Flavobacterium sp. LHD-80]MDQ6469825.1 hypothetical protein [Flavobacterium sp. LHD-80]